LWRVNRIASEYSRAVWDASDANPMKKYREGFKLAEYDDAFALAGNIHHPTKVTGAVVTFVGLSNRKIRRTIGQLT
jgi:hypothetical protein